MTNRQSFAAVLATAFLTLLISSPQTMAQCVVFEADLTKGKPKDSRIVYKGGQWEKGWRVVGDVDQIVINAGQDIKNGYAEVAVTRKGKLEFPDVERKRNWMGVFACDKGNQCPGGYARTGAPLYEFSKAEIFSANQTHTICEQKFGKLTDWVLDDKTEHVVRAEVKNNIMTWSNNKGGTTSCGSNTQPVTHFRYVTVGGILNEKLPWHHGSLVGLRVLKVKIVDNDKPKGCKQLTATKN
jgi:hypothetical protein